MPCINTVSLEGGSANGEWMEVKWRVHSSTIDSIDCRTSMGGAIACSRQIFLFVSMMAIVPFLWFRVMSTVILTSAAYLITHAA